MSLFGQERIGDIEGIGCWPGTVRPGSAPGATSMMTLSTTRTIVVPYVASRRHGIVFSIAISPATTAIQVTLITPSAKSDAISAQQQPTHHAPLPTPIRNVPAHPERQEPSSVPSGLRHFPRQTSLRGVSS